jgi:phage FluMu protein Com
MGLFEKGGPVPYYRCPSCGMLAHIAGDGAAPITCPRCRAIQKEVQLLPVEESLQLAPEDLAEESRAERAK